MTVAAETSRLADPGLACCSGHECSGPSETDPTWFSLLEILALSGIFHHKDASLTHPPSSLRSGSHKSKADWLHLGDFEYKWTDKYRKLFANLFLKLPLFGFWLLASFG